MQHWIISLALFDQYVIYQGSNCMLWNNDLSLFAVADAVEYVNVIV